MISITNLKFTTDGSGEPAVTAYIDQETVVDAPMLMRAMYGSAAEKDTFEPEFFATRWDARRVKKWSVLTVTTSEDVESITVNDTEITGYQRVREKGSKNSATYKRVWIYKEKLSAAGSYSYYVTAYSANGTASNPVETVLTVSK